MKKISLLVFFYIIIWIIWYLSYTHFLENSEIENYILQYLIYLKFLIITISIIYFCYFYKKNKICNILLQLNFIIILWIIINFLLTNLIMLKFQCSLILTWIILLFGLFLYFPKNNFIYFIILPIFWIIFLFIILLIFPTYDKNVNLANTLYQLQIYKWKQIVFSGNCIDYSNKTWINYKLIKKFTDFDFKKTTTLFKSYKNIGSGLFCNENIKNDFKKISLQKYNWILSNSKYLEQIEFIKLYLLSIFKDQIYQDTNLQDTFQNFILYKIFTDNFDLNFQKLLQDNIK